MLVKTANAWEKRMRFHACFGPFSVQTLLMTLCPLCIQLLLASPLLQSQLLYLNMHICVGLTWYVAGLIK